MAEAKQPPPPDTGVPFTKLFSPQKDNTRHFTASIFSITSLGQLFFCIISLWTPPWISPLLVPIERAQQM